jgi:single-strand DNA-binding protein
MSLNQVVLIGRTTREAEIKYTPSGTAVAKFTLAVDQIPRQGEEKEADFIPCVCFGKQAEFAANYLGKGRLVAVTGRLSVRHYQDQSGQNKTFTEVVCNNVQGLDKPRADQNGAGGAAPAYPAYSEEELDSADPFAG